MMLCPALIQEAVVLALAMSGLSLFLGFIRLVLGPSLPDRVVALDMIGVVAVGIIAAYDIYTDEPVLLDAATVVGLIAFLGTIAFARYVERRRRDE